jgi:hypothetical protein
MDKRLVVHVQYDDEAGVWVATSDDVPGLATEAADYRVLRARVRAVAPELLRDNGCVRRLPDARSLRLHFEHGASFD